MRQSAAEKVANHLSADIETVKDHRYQPTYYSTPVFLLGDDRWGAGARPPKNRYSDDTEVWEKVISVYDGKTVLWRFTPP
jgi:hypothetical protein